MAKMKRLFCLIMAVLMMISIPQVAYGDTLKSRIYGNDRIDTALAVANIGWQNGTHTVVLAAADTANLIDAIAAAPLAGQFDIPILLTYKDSLDQRVRNKLANWSINTIYVVGAVSNAVCDDLEEIAGMHVITLKGMDRYETAKLINQQLQNPAGTIVVGYDEKADGLAASSYAAAYRYAVVLTNPSGNIPAGQTLYGGSTIIVGNTDKIKDISGALRISGPDRYARNLGLIQKLPYSYDKVYLANGNDNHLVDSLAVSSLAGRIRAPILLTDNYSLITQSAVNAKLKSTSEIITLGGPTVVSDAVRDNISYASTLFWVESIKSLSLNFIEVRFTEKVDKSSSENISNYLINGNNLTVGKFAGSTATLQNDGQTVKIILYQPAAAGEALSVKVLSGVIFDQNKIRKSSESEFSISMADNSQPTAISVKMTGDKQLSVEFSEPVRVPALADAEKWMLDFATLKSRDLQSVTGPQNANNYDYIIQLNFEDSIKDGLGAGLHKLKVMAGSSQGQLSDATNTTVREQEVEFTTN